MSRLLVLLALVCFTVPAASAQTTGGEIQVYPAGVIATARYSHDLPENARLHIYAGMNATDRRDWGEHVVERGAGFGGGVAGHKYLRDSRLGPWIGLRMDVWAITIEWEDPGRRGETDITILQPTARAGWTLMGGNVIIDLNASLGAEVNVKTTGESVGQGAIFLLGAAFSF